MTSQWVGYAILLGIAGFLTLVVLLPWRLTQRRVKSSSSTHPG